MAKIITIAELKKRCPGIKFRSDKSVYVERGSISVRQAQRKNEKYPHTKMTSDAVQYFLSKGWDVYPHGLTVNDEDNSVRAVSDLALDKGQKVVFIECLSPQWLNQEKEKLKDELAEKRTLQKYYPLWFVVQDPGSDDRDFDDSLAGNNECTNKINLERYRKNAKFLTRKYTVFFWTSDGRIRRARRKPKLKNKKPATSGGLYKSSRSSSVT